MDQEHYNKLLTLMQSSDNDLVGFCFSEMKNSSTSYVMQLRDIKVKGTLYAMTGRNEMQKQGIIERELVQGYDTLISNLKKLDPEDSTKVYWLYSDHYMFSLYTSNEDSIIQGVLFHSDIKVNDAFIINKLLKSASPVYKFRNGIYVDD